MKFLIALTFMIFTSAQAMADDFGARFGNEAPAAFGDFGGSDALADAEALAGISPAAGEDDDADDDAGADAENEDTSDDDDESDDEDADESDEHESDDDESEDDEEGDDD